MNVGQRLMLVTGFVCHPDGIARNLFGSQMQHVAEVRNGPFPANTETGHDPKVAILVSLRKAQSKAVVLPVSGVRVASQPLSRAHMFQLNYVAVKDGVFLLSSLILLDSDFVLKVLRKEEGEGRRGGKEGEGVGWGARSRWGTPMRRVPTKLTSCFTLCSIISLSLPFAAKDFLLESSCLLVLES